MSRRERGDWDITPEEIQRRARAIRDVKDRNAREENRQGRCHGGIVRQPEFVGYDIRDLYWMTPADIARFQQ